MDWQTRAVIEDHETWLGFCQPVGLVVAAPVLAGLGVVIDRNMRSRQEAFAELVDEEEAKLLDPRRLFIEFLGWRDADLAEPAETHRKTLVELGVVLEPNWAVADADGAWQLLVRVEPDGTDLDKSLPEAVDGWTASPQARFERLLREADIPVGVLVTPEAVRLVHAPKGETSGHVTFRVADMASVMGRPILAAMELLLGEDRLFRAPANLRLPALLHASREAQNTVSTRLARQVLAALHELLRGFVVADARDPVRPGRLVDLARHDPQQVYGGLVTALMRLVFVLYAEDRDLMPSGAVYEQHYGVRGLFAKLRDDQAKYGDMMDRRFGAWARLLSMFRLIHRGGGRDGIRFTARRGRLFDPDQYPFLEGRDAAADPVAALPMVPDGTVWRILENLLVLDGERLTYRSLDVEQIGSVYETVMGFTVDVMAGRALALHTKSKHGAAVVIDLDELAGLAPAARLRRLADLDVRKLSPRETAALRAAADVPALAAAFEGKVDRAATPRITAPGTPVLQPTEERRRSGSHYTPRSLTQPIVAETLGPILDRLGVRATPEQILELRVLDPAMGSAAFLVEACRQLAEALVRAWEVHGIRPDLPADEDALLHARRLVAQRCLYGVDRNAMAAELGKLSLWLATLARDHEFTFLDHCIRHGDSLVGLNRQQLGAMDWAARPGTEATFTDAIVRTAIEKAERERDRIRAALEGVGEDAMRPLLDRADAFLEDVRLIGDATVAAFFGADRPRAREAERAAVAQVLDAGQRNWREVYARRRADLFRRPHPVYPFHYQIEFPEVFGRDNPGFDAVIGNPPFAGKNTLIAANHSQYPDWLQAMHAGAHGNSDLVAHFFRRAYGLLRQDGCLGLIATNTIRQGDTRATGLRPIRHAGGTIYSVRRRIKWPGEAAVVVSVVHIAKGDLSGSYRIDGREVPVITAFLFHAGGDDDPSRLEANAGKSFIGSYVLGMGFTFDDTDTSGTANPVSLMHELIARDPRNAERIVPYIGGEEVNDSPTHAHHRWVINFGDFPLRRNDLGATWADADARQRREWLREGVVPLDYPEPVAADWPDILGIVEAKVRPARAHLTTNAIGRQRAKFWWQYASAAIQLYEAIQRLRHIWALSRVGEKLAIAKLPTESVYAETIVVFAMPQAAFSVLQSQLHETWTRFFASSLEDRLRYTPTDCFETFPFPPPGAKDERLEGAGQAYFEHRAPLMVANDEGLTKTYNRFHDPEETTEGILELRRLHAAMDRAVLDAYGWSDIPTDCVFELEWEDEEEDDGAGRRRRRPWRYRWPEAVRDEVLARLLALNRARAAEEEEDRRRQAAQ